MTRPATVLVDLDDLPGQCSDAIAAVMSSRALRFVDGTGVVTDGETLQILGEMGREVAQVVALSEVEP